MELVRGVPRPKRFGVNADGFANGFRGDHRSVSREIVQGGERMWGG